MAFCRKCGAVMAEDDAFCSRCGASVASTIPSAGAAPAAPTAPAPVQAPAVNQNFGVGQKPATAGHVVNPYSPAARIAAARGEGQQNRELSKGELLQLLQRYRDVLRDIENVERASAEPSEPSRPETPVRYYTFIRFYWPFFLISFFAFWIIYFITVRVAVETLSLSAIRVGIAIAIIASVGSLLFGIKVAKDKQETANNWVYNNNYGKTFDKKKASQVRFADKSKLEPKKRALERELPPALLPKYRTYESMSIIVRQLKFERAHTLEEALAQTDEEIIRKTI